MITITLTEPDAMETLATLKIESAKQTEHAGLCVRRQLAAQAQMHAQRAEQLNKVAEAVWRALLLQRGITEP
jgi:hypothetical protein